MNLLSLPGILPLFEEFSSLGCNNFEKSMEVSFEKSSLEKSSLGGSDICGGGTSL